MAELSLEDVALDMGDSLDAIASKMNENLDHMDAKLAEKEQRQRGRLLNSIQESLRDKVRLSKRPGGPLMLICLCGGSCCGDSERHYLGVTLQIIRLCPA